jgi:hypothetical protein
MNIKEERRERKKTPKKKERNFPPVVSTGILTALDPPCFRVFASVRFS